MTLISENVTFGAAKSSVNSRLVWDRKNDPGAFSFRAISYDDGSYSAHIFDESFTAICSAATLRQAFNSAMNMVVEYLNR